MITDMNSRVAMAQKLSIPQLQQAIKNGTIPAYVGVPLLQDKMRQQQQMQMAAQQQQGIAAERPPIAEEIMAQAGAMGGVDQLPSNLPVTDDEEEYAGGGIVAFAGNSGSLVPKTPQYSSEPKDTDENQPQPTAPSIFDIPAWFRNRIKAAEERAAGERVELAYPKDQRVESPAESETGLASAQAEIAQREPETIGPQGLRSIPFTPARAANPPGAGTPAASAAGIPAVAPRAATPAAETAAAPVSALDKYAEMLMKEREGIAKDRQQAKAMALVQAGLGVAGGTSPNPFANLAQGIIPATQAYQAEMKGIRREDADRLKHLMSMGVSKEKLALEARKLGITEKHFEDLYNLGMAKVGAAGADRAALAAERNELARERRVDTMYRNIQSSPWALGKSPGEILRAAQEAVNAGRDVQETPAAPSGVTVRRIS